MGKDFKPSFWLINSTFGVLKVEKFAEHLKRTVNFSLNQPYCLSVLGARSNDQNTGDLDNFLVIKANIDRFLKTG